MGMFADPGTLDVGATAPEVSMAPGAGAVSVGGGGTSPGGAGMPATTFTRPVSAFEPGVGGRPVGLRPSGALGTETLSSPTRTVAGNTIGGMPVGRPTGDQRRSDDTSTQPATVRVVDDPVP
jgi:hypothetical protein